MNVVTKNVGTGKPMEARIVDDGRKAKIFPEPDATKKNAIKQRAVVAISNSCLSRQPAAVRRAVLRWPVPIPARRQKRRHGRTGSVRLLRVFLCAPNRAAVLRPSLAM